MMEKIILMSVYPDMTKINITAYAISQYSQHMVMISTQLFTPAHWWRSQYIHRHFWVINTKILTQKTLLEFTTLTSASPHGMELEINATKEELKKRATPIMKHNNLQHLNSILVHRHVDTSKNITSAMIIVHSTRWMKVLRRNED